MRIWITGAKGMHKTAPKTNTTVRDGIVQKGVTFIRLTNGRVLIVADRHLNRVTVK